MELLFGCNFPDWFFGWVMGELGRVLGLLDLDDLLLYCLVFVGYLLIVVFGTWVWFAGVV